MEKENALKRCNTCTKKNRTGKCEVLLENIGLKQDCWAWSDDWEWREKVKKAVCYYQARVGGGKNA